MARTHSDGIGIEMIKFLTSVKTYLWITGLSIAVYIIGSVVIPANLDVFSEINDIPLFEWFSLNRRYLLQYSWIWLLIILMAVLSANTIACIIDALARGAGRRDVIGFFSPQMLHLAVLFVLLGHMVSALYAYREDVPMTTGAVAEVRGLRLMLNDLEFIQVQGEDSPRWRVGLKVDDRLFTLEPAQPAFVDGIGFFAKSANEKRKTAVIGIVYDPGARWEVIGAAMFVLAALGLCYVQLRR